VDSSPRLRARRNGYDQTARAAALLDRTVVATDHDLAIVRRIRADLAVEARERILARCDRLLRERDLARAEQASALADALALRAEVNWLLDDLDAADDEANQLAYQNRRLRTDLDQARAWLGELTGTPCS
jgi:hypothetical protein